MTPSSPSLSTIWRGRRLAAPAALLLALLAAGAGRVRAQQAGLNVNARPDPAVTSSSNPAYFVYQLPAGSVLQDALLITNQGEVPAELVLFPADAATAANGGIAFPAGFGEAPQRAGAWLSLSLERLTLQPGEARSVPFTFTIPPQASGEHAAGIVIQPAQVPTPAAGQFGVSVVERVAVTVLLQVPGDNRTGLEIAALSASSEGGRQALVAELRNSGELGFYPEGRLTLAQPGGALAREVEIRLGYFLARDAIRYEISLDPPLPAGEYEVSLRLTHPDGEAEWNGRLRLGEPEVIPVVGAEETPAAGAGVQGVPLAWVAIGAGVLLLVVLLVALVAYRLGRGR